MVDVYQNELSMAGLSLQPHQVSGVKHILGWCESNHGGIIADDMGLGKTCQTIAVLNILENFLGGIRSLVIAPLSVIDHWETEIKRFGLGKLDCLRYTGNKETRAQLLKKLLKDEWNIVLTTYQSVISDANVFQRKWNFDILVFDEAHRVKSSKSLLHQIVREIPVKWTLLLTGTPIQNNLKELYSLLVLVDRKKFLIDEDDKFLDKYKSIDSEDVAKELRGLLSVYLLRRTKAEVEIEVPASTQVILYHGITGIQRSIYRAILAKNYRVLQSFVVGQSDPSQRNTVTLLNVLMQLRKCVSHPYLFEGVEPEPFEEGEHLVEASGKLVMLDQVLQFLLANRHRVLIFSQMTRVLDIVQDFLTYRGLSYERLDGSVRAEERYAAIKSFQESDSETFCFLLSTRAGGVGLNLTGADTVIFLDSDFNPQNDLQAAARCHRIGQTKPVKVIRFIAKNTVEEAIYSRACKKLEMTSRVLGNSQLEKENMSASEVSKILLYGLGHLNEADSMERRESLMRLEAVIGRSERGCWVVDDEECLPSSSKSDYSADFEEDGVAKENISSGETLSNNDSMYVFEGHDYKKDREVMASIIDEGYTNDVMDKKTNQTVSSRKLPTDEEVQRRAENARKRKKELAEKKEKRKKLAEEKKMRLWTENNYSSCNLPLGVADSRPESVDVFAANDSGDCGPFFVIGDVTRPTCNENDPSEHAIIAHVVDNSGKFGHGGVFNALRRKSAKIEQVYSLAKHMEDLCVGYALLVDGVEEATDSSCSFDSCGLGPSTSRTVTRRKESVVLLVAQDAKRRDEISRDALAESLSRLANYVAGRGDVSSVHVPRIGYGMRNIQWYIIERLIRKYLTGKGIPTYVYYFRRNGVPTDQFGMRKKDSLKDDADSKTQDANLASPVGCDENEFEDSEKEQDVCGSPNISDEEGI